MTRDEAERAVLHELSCSYKVADDELALIDERTRTTSYGWIFFYNSKRYLETRNFIYALGGNGPVVVEAATGRITRLGSSRPVEDEIEDFERNVLNS